MPQSQAPPCNCRRVMIDTIKPEYAIVPTKPRISNRAILARSGIADQEELPYNGFLRYGQVQPGFLDSAP